MKIVDERAPNLVQSSLLEDGDYGTNQHNRYAKRHQIRN